jgi:hypothetical protein
MLYVACDSPQNILSHTSLSFFYLMELGFELRASCLQSRHEPTDVQSTFYIAIRTGFFFFLTQGLTI